MPPFSTFRRDLHTPICIPPATRLPSRLQSRPGRCSRQHFARRDGTNAHAHFRLGVSFKGKGGGRAQRELHSPSHLLMMAPGLRDFLYQYRLEVKVCLLKFCFSFHPIDGWRRQIHPPGRKGRRCFSASQPMSPADSLIMVVPPASAALVPW